MLTQEESAIKAESVRIALLTLHEVEEVTCEQCELNDRCDLAWDLYNINGNCLAEK